MKILIFLFVILILILIMIPSKEKFYGNLLYPRVQNYYKNGYEYKLYRNKKRFKNNFNFRTYIPLVKHILI